MPEPRPAAEGGSARARTLLEAGAIAALALVGTWLQRGHGGIQSPWLAFVALLVGPAFRRWLVLRGRASAAPLWIFGLEVVGFAAALGQPFTPWGLALEGAAALGTAWSAGSRKTEASGESPAASRLERLAPLGLAALAFAAAVVRDPESVRAGTLALEGGLALALALAFAPGAARTARANARRVAVFSLLLAEACVLGHLEESAPVLTESVTRGLAVVAASLELAALWREHGPATPAPQSVQRATRRAFGVAVTTLAVLLVLGPLVVPERRVDLASLPRHALAGYARVADRPAATFPIWAAGAVQVLEDGRPLRLQCARTEEVAELGSGRFVLPRGAVVWSSSDGTDPLGNGRRYELEIRPAPHRSVPTTLAFALAVGLLVLAWSQGAIDLLRPSSRRESALVTLLVAAALAAGLPARWDRIAVAADSGGYLAHTSLRTPLYPAFLDAFDARPEEPRALSWAFPAGARALPDHRFLEAIHVQKLFALASIALLVWVLAGSFNAWLVGAIVWVALGVDLTCTGDGGASFNVEAILSEGLNHSLVFLLVAAALAYLRRPGWLVGAALAALGALLLLNRPANAPLAIVFAAVWLRHARQEGVRFASLRTLGLALVTAIPLLGACAQTYRATGYFRLHAFTGPSVFCTTFSLATPDDVDAFPEPELHELMRRCILEEGSRRISTDSQDFVNVNLYEIGLPVYEAVTPGPPGLVSDYVRDDRLAVVGKRLVRRHPLAFARLVLGQLGSVLSWTVHGPLAAGFVASALLWWRRRRPLDLFGAWLCALPVLAILPSCVFNVPLDRYRSQLAWVEVVAVPLVLALVFAPEPTPLVKPVETGASP